MTQNHDIIMYKCVICNYSSKRKHDLKRHVNAIHKNIKVYNYDKNKSCENVHPLGENVHPLGENVHPLGENVHPKFICKKCNKIYKSNRYLIEHEKKCKGVDELTCPKCMLSFSSRQAKANHINRNNCKARSVIYARKSNIQNMEKKNIKTQNNIEIQNNIENQNVINNITNNNIYINNYGKERIDYLNYEKMLEIFKKVYDIPSLLTKEIHFNIDFPENNNIMYKNENTTLLKVDEEFIYKGINNLVQELITEKTKIMQKFAIENKDDICLKIDTYLYEEIIEHLLNLILLKEPSEHYKKQVNIIRDMIKNMN